MNRLFIFVFSFLLLLPIGAAARQSRQSDTRTPEEIAQKQTHRLIRELDLRDSVQIDTLYKMHLKYARMRVKSNTRREDLERLTAMTDELRGILTEEQYNKFMNKQVCHSPHGNASPVGPMPQRPAEGQRRKAKQ